MTGPSGCLQMLVATQGPSTPGLVLCAGAEEKCGDGSLMGRGNLTPVARRARELQTTPNTGNPGAATCCILRSHTWALLAVSEASSLWVTANHNHQH